MFEVNKGEKRNFIQLIVFFMVCKSINYIFLFYASFTYTCTQIFDLLLFSLLPPSPHIMTSYEFSKEGNFQIDR